MVIFMTGGTGNIGQYVTFELLKRGHKIKLLSRTPDRIKAFSQMEKFFGLSFDSGEDIKEHIRWNLDEALKRK